MDDLPPGFSSTKECRWHYVHISPHSSTRALLHSSYLTPSLTLEVAFCLDTGFRKKGDQEAGRKVVLNPCRNNYGMQKWILAPYGDDQR